MIKVFHIAGVGYIMGKVITPDNKGAQIIRG